MSKAAFKHWVDKYGGAWQAKDVDAFGDLFSNTARYYWTPFEKPKCGVEEIAGAFRDAVATQENIHFEYNLIACQDDTGLAHWVCRFNRPGRVVEIDGILRGHFNKDGLCEEFREWWHSAEQ